MRNEKSQSKEGEVNIKVKSKRLFPVIITVTCALVLMLYIQLFRNKSDFELPNSTRNVSVQYINKVPSSSFRFSSLLINLTEEVLFHNYDTNIFMGKIEDINNIKINYNGSIEYLAIANIRIDKSYRGNGTVGDTVSVLLPCPMNTSAYYEDTEVVSSMRVGMTGIFMPIKYDETTYSEKNGAKIYWMDIVEYGFLDGVRFAFLNSDNGLIYDKHSYESIDSATTLEEIEPYIMKMIE